MSTSARIAALNRKLEGRNAHPGSYGRNHYTATFRGKEIEVDADTKLQAQDYAASIFKARNLNEVIVKEASEGRVAAGNTRQIGKEIKRLYRDAGDAGRNLVYKAMSDQQDDPDMFARLEQILRQFDNMDELVGRSFSS